MAKFQLRVIGRFEAHLRGNEDHVDVTVLAGPDWDHLSICGTLTMTQGQFEDFHRAMKKALPRAVRLDYAPSVRVASAEAGI